MTRNVTLEKGRAAYLEKIKSGEIEKSVALDPIQKAKANPPSLRAEIKEQCYDCSCYQRTEVTKCQAKDCPLHRIRPWKKSNVEDE